MAKRLVFLILLLQGMVKNVLSIIGPGSQLWSPAGPDVPFPILPPLDPGTHAHFPPYGYMDSRMGQGYFTPAHWAMRSTQLQFPPQGYYRSFTGFPPQYGPIPMQRYYPDYGHYSMSPPQALYHDCSRPHSSDSQGPGQNPHYDKYVVGNPGPLQHDSANIKENDQQSRSTSDSNGNQDSMRKQSPNDYGMHRDNYYSRYNPTNSHSYRSAEKPYPERNKSKGSMGQSYKVPVPPSDSKKLWKPEEYPQRKPLSRSTKGQFDSSEVDNYGGYPDYSDPNKSNYHQHQFSREYESSIDFNNTVFDLPYGSGNIQGNYYNHPCVGGVGVGAGGGFSAGGAIGTGSGGGSGSVGGGGVPDGPSSSGYYPPVDGKPGRVTSGFNTIPCSPGYQYSGYPPPASGYQPPSSGYQPPSSGYQSGYQPPSSGYQSGYQPPY